MKDNFLLPKIIFSFFWIVMFVSIGYGLLYGDFSGEGSVLLSMLWGRITLVDIYVMFFAFSFWIVFREKSWRKSAVWIFFMMVLGSLTACTYVLKAIFTSKNDWKKFWMGAR